MPPPISDGEISASETEIPYKATKQDTVKGTIADGEEEDDDDDSAINEEEYIVESVISHAFEKDGTVKYEIKWQGYEKKADRTWEPEENLSGAQDALEDYFRRIGGRPAYVPEEKKGKRKQSSGAVDSPKGKGRKRAKASQDEDDEENAGGRKGRSALWEPPKGTWEYDVENIDTVEEEPDPKTGEMRRKALIAWNNGKKTTHLLKVVNQKCPQKMLRYYEQHLVFKPRGSDVGAFDTNGAVKDE